MIVKAKLEGKRRRKGRGKRKLGWREGERGDEEETGVGGEEEREMLMTISAREVLPLHKQFIS